MIVVAMLLAAAQAAPATVVAPAPAPASAPTTPASRLNLDTPLETIVADAKGKAVIDADLPGVSNHPSYEMFKGMSLHQLQAYAADRLTDTALAKVATDLAAIR